MTREDQRLMLVGSALTGLMAQHAWRPLSHIASEKRVEPAHYTDDELADAALKAVKVADLTLTAIGARIPDKGDVYERLGDCWALLEEFVTVDSRNGWFGERAWKLLREQKGVANG